jgi:hypothetical protein
VKAEQDIDYEFVKRFELAVAERDEFRSLLSTCTALDWDKIRFLNTQQKRT